MRQFRHIPMNTTTSLLATTDWFPLGLSLKVSAVATLLALIAGVALGWVFARKRFPGRTVLEAVFMLPLVLPPTVLGYGILVLAGRRSPLGAWLREHLDYTIIFSWHGAVVASAVVAGEEHVDGETQREIGRRKDHIDLPPIEHAMQPRGERPKDRGREASDEREVGDTLARLGPGRLNERRKGGLVQYERAGHPGPDDGNGEDDTVGRKGRHE